MAVVFVGDWKVEQEILQTGYPRGIEPLLGLWTDSRKLFDTCELGGETFVLFRHGARVVDDKLQCQQA